MRNVVFARLNCRRYITSSSKTALFHDGTTKFNSWKLVTLGDQNCTGLARKKDFWFPSYLLQQHLFYTTSIHGGRPSAKYAKWRKESLESEFGLALGAYRSKGASILYRFGPFLALYRAAIISFHVLKLTIWQFFVQDINKRAVKFRETLIRLGPFYIKLGQALSTRPDILPTVYCKELAKLQDQIPPFPTDPGAYSSCIFRTGVQSLAAHLHSGELVAVKVQRPGLPQQLLYLEIISQTKLMSDSAFEAVCCADPEIQEEKIDSSLEFLILASDGLWDVVTNEEAVDMTKPIQDPEEAAKRLMLEAYHRGSLQHNKMQLSITY
ncbi:hypothetical protein LWI28_013280 [Acer negundo]|uniref:PPM-type phosphatase domain-containing protein n=1 Tax=Acer negundo TaxID=4023 RepID=A0AAD5NZL5_ACENE|nr:hypothetical protein LWI28_013280 [Acer negundo]